VGILSKFSSLSKSEAEKEIDKFMRSKFGYRPKNILFFTHALTHKSLLYADDTLVSNERLEFLGDAVLDAVIAEYLFRLFPKEDEGYLTKVKSKFVSRKSISAIAEKIKIRTVLGYQKGRTINMSTIEGNAFEALMGAIFIDGGFLAAKDCIENHILKKYADVNKILEEEIDFKSKLFIWCQKNRHQLEFEMMEEENAGGFWKYTMMAKINQKNFGLGTGSSKKIAEQAASKETLELLGEV
jgi:ribonuclease III